MGWRPASGLHWFRRDLREFDNPALDAAGLDRVGVFVHDPYFSAVGEPRAAHLRAALSELDVLEVAGDPAAQLIRLARSHETDRVVCTGDTTPYGRRRDEQVRAELAAHGISLEFIDTPYAIPPGVVRNQAGAGFQVFTPFYKAWLAQGWGAPKGRIPATPAVRRWRKFRKKDLADYKQNRDLAALDGTSRLSAALHFGQIHPRTILADVPDPQTDPFVRQLAWREFCADVLWHRPHAAWASLDERFDTDMEYSDNADHFEAWTQGRTGFPFVDAGMRQLLKEGWMHNRLRLVTASFLIKDLHLPWQWGAKWFLQHLVDGDVANNQLGWQWVAGCGTDAAPYFRIFNPVTQGRRFDPDGAFIRRYVPELADATDPHEPGLLAPDYPAPIVDHAHEREVALARFQALPAR